MSRVSRTFFLFAVVHEARPFVKRLSALDPSVRRIPPLSGSTDPAWKCRAGEIHVGGMGQSNAAAVMEHLKPGRSDRVLTCGFAGGLNATLATGDVVFDVDPELEEIGRILEDGGGRRVRFHCDSRVATTPAEKAVLRGGTGADAVEMESGVIRRLCRDRGVSSATVRVISDAAHESLPLDFNALMTPRMTMHYGKLAGTLASRPWVIPRLMRFQKHLGAASGALAESLVRLAAR